MLPNPRLLLSPYLDLYEKLIPKVHILRRLLDVVDFSFIYEELDEKYCHTNGRTAVDPIQMFKYLVLKVLYCMSDIDLIERARYDMSFKFFLGLEPEADVIHPSLLTKFRRQRIKDDDLLDLLIAKTVTIAIEYGILKGRSIIIDSVHTVSRYNRKSAGKYLADKSKLVRKNVYNTCEDLKKGFPKKPQSLDFEEQKKYSEDLIEYLNKCEETKMYPAIKQSVNLLEEALSDLNASSIVSDDPDGKHLPTLVEKTEAAGYQVDEILGDKAYSIKNNLIYAEENNIKLYSALSKSVTHVPTSKIQGFEYDKDAGMYICPAGHMATHKKHNAKNGQGENPQIRYYYDVEKCKNCPRKEGCYKEGAKSKSYTVKEICPEHQHQMDFQETDEFKERLRERYKIEAKNGELKSRHGYDKADYSGIDGMWIQGAITLFVVNLKRIIKLIDKK